MSDEELRASLHKLANSTSIGCDWRSEEHYQAARKWSSVHRWLALPTAIFAAVAATAIVADSTQESVVFFGGLLTVVVAALTAASGVLTPDQRMSEHKKGFDGFAAMRTRFLLFRDCTLQLDKSYDVLVAELDTLLSKRDDLAASVPEPPMWARRNARQAREKRKQASGAPPTED